MTSGTLTTSREKRIQRVRQPSVGAHEGPTVKRVSIRMNIKRARSESRNY